MYCGKLQQSLRTGKRIVLAAVFVPQHARHKPDHRVDHHHRGDFAPVEDEIADRNLLRLQEEPDAFVKTLVPAAQQQDPPLCGQPFDRRLVEPAALAG